MLVQGTALTRPMREGWPHACLQQEPLILTGCISDRIPTPYPSVKPPRKTIFQAAPRLTASAKVKWMAVPFLPFLASTRGIGVRASPHFLFMGRRPRTRAAPPPEPMPSDALAALLVNAPPERQQRLVDALWDRACGIYWWAGDEKKPGGKDIGTEIRRVRVTDAATGEELEGAIYTLPPDVTAGKLLLEHNVGRPAQREAAKTETAIYLVHRVRGRNAAKEQMAVEGPGPAEEPDGDVATLGDEEYGVQALMRVEPEDTLADGEA